MGRRSKAPPADFVLEHGVWPEGPFAVNAPVYVRPLATVAQRLAHVAATRDLSQRGLAQLTGVNLNTVNYILAGRVIPDTATLALLEHTLGERLWPEMAAV